MNKLLIIEFNLLSKKCKIGILIVFFSTRSHWSGSFLSNYEKTCALSMTMPNIIVESMIHVIAFL